MYVLAGTSHLTFGFSVNFGALLSGDGFQKIIQMRENFLRSLLLHSMRVRKVSRKFLTRKIRRYVRLRLAIEKFFSKNNFN